MLFITIHNYKYTLGVTSTYYTSNGDETKYIISGMNPYHIDLFGDVDLNISSRDTVWVKI